MKVLFVAGEALPFASSGGLGDVIGSLPAALAKTGDVDVRVIMPLYSAISDEYREKFTFLKSKTVALAWRKQYCGIFSYAHKGVTFYFIDNEYYFKRSRLYGEFDDGERFAFFCRAVLEILPDIDFFPDVLHAHDWHAALSVVYLKQCYAKLDKRYSGIRAVLTIHNIQYQGKFGMDILGDVFGLMDSDKEIVEYFGGINLLKGGIVCADAVTTVSPTYAREIMTSEYSYGLDGILKRFYFKLTGILNGIDTELYNPSKDKDIAQKYSWRKPDGKSECKRSLQRELGLPERDVPVLAVVSRLVGHKGLDLVMLAGEEIISRDIQFVVLGMGEEGYENFFRSLADRHGDKCRALITYDRALSKRVYSACDVFIMPSRSEPCGLSQMIASRYGAVPVIHETGGLYDSIKDVGLPGGGNGFTFAAYSAYELRHAVDRALDMYYGDREAFETLRKRVMRVDFTWDKSAQLYNALYEKTLLK